MVKTYPSKDRAVATVIVGACVIASVFNGVSLLWPEEDASTQSLRRSMQEVSSDNEEMDALSHGEGPDVADEISLLMQELSREEEEEEEMEGPDLIPLVQELSHEDEGGPPEDLSPFMYPWAQMNLRPITRAPESKETVVFWHIPKSGGSTAKSIYRCMGKTIDIESQPQSILEAERMGLVPSGKVDIIFSSFPSLAVDHLFDPLHKGRMIAMFRHPVERLISKFYYLQVATWEKTYRPEWNDLEILTWVQQHNMDNDHMVKKLAGKLQRDHATEVDLFLAKRTVKGRFVVGLMSEMEESIRRFNTVIGIDETEKRTRGCLAKFFGGEDRKKTNSNSHPKVEKDSPAWQLLAEKNSLDIKLYEYVLELFEEQREIIESYSRSVDVSTA